VSDRVCLDGNITFTKTVWIGPFPMTTTTTCTGNTLEGRVASNGAGFFYAMSLTGCSTPLSPCDANGDGLKENWAFEIAADASASTSTNEIAFCFVRSGETYNCHLMLWLTEPTSHTYNLHSGAGTPPAAGACENDPNITVSGRWLPVFNAAHPKIEIRP
jgi:hypothetical protein